MGIGALFEHENHRGTGLKLIADRFLLLIERKMLDVTWRAEHPGRLRHRAARRLHARQEKALHVNALAHPCLLFSGQTYFSI